jgi:hypothetical protein
MALSLSKLTSRRPYLRIVMVLLLLVCLCAIRVDDAGTQHTQHGYKVLVQNRIGRYKQQGV